jgi:hypothetical protein
MDIRREIVSIVVLLILIALLVKAIEFFKMDVVEADAREFVLEELHTKYPTADVEIMAVTAQYNDEGERYFEVKTRVTEDPFGPCPQRSHIFYNYPVQNFVPQLPEVITSGCAVCTDGICTIAFSEEAVIASHTFDGTEAVHSFIESYPDATPLVSENPESWLVTWGSSNADYQYEVEVHRDGSILEVVRADKS